MPSLQVSVLSPAHWWLADQRLAPVPARSQPPIAIDRAASSEAAADLRHLTSLAAGGLFQ